MESPKVKRNVLLATSAKERFGRISSKSLLYKKIIQNLDFKNGKNIAAKDKILTSNGISENIVDIYQVSTAIEN